MRFWLCLFLVACATAGIVVGVVGQTGIGLIYPISDRNVWRYIYGLRWLLSRLRLSFWVWASCYRRLYRVLSIMAVPALMDFGVTLLAAHDSVLVITNL